MREKLTRLNSDEATRLRLRELSGRWGMSMQDALRRAIAEALRQEHTREVGSSAAGE